MAEGSKVVGARSASGQGGGEGIKIQRAQSLLSAVASNYYACRSLHFVVMCRLRQSSSIGVSGCWWVSNDSVVGDCDPDRRMSFG
jgi:hypothetical protein